MRRERLLRAVLAGAAAFPAGYILPGRVGLPTIAYDPFARVFLLTVSPLPTHIRYYSDIAYACVAALLFGSLSWLLGRKERPFEAAAALGSLLALVALDVAYYLSILLRG